MMSKAFHRLDPCPVDNTPVRDKFVPSKSGGKNSRVQHSRWMVCEKGHQLYRKRGRRI